MAADSPFRVRSDAEPRWMCRCRCPMAHIPTTSNRQALHRNVMPHSARVHASCECQREKPCVFAVREGPVKHCITTSYEHVLKLAESGTETAYGERDEALSHRDTSHYLFKELSHDESHPPRLYPDRASDRCRHHRHSCRDRDSEVCEHQVEGVHRRDEVGPA